MEKLLDAKTYRRIVDFLENELEVLTDDSAELSKLFIPVVGNLQYFPRPSKHARVLEDQLSLLKERIREAIAILNTLAVIAQANEEPRKKLPVYSLLEEHMKVQVKFYVDYFFERDSQKPPDKADKETSYDDKKQE